VIEVEHLDAAGGGEGAGAIRRKRFVTALSFRVAEGLEGPPAPPLTVPSAVRWRSNVLARLRRQTNKPSLSF
jgi:hypothetical protein